jgi:hypothetical protein
MKFTDRYINNLKPQEKEFFVTEGRGLAIRVQPSGIKTFYLRYTFKGKEKKLALGTYPIISLAEAHDKYATALAQVRQGTDPAVKPKAEPEPKKEEINEDEVTVGWMSKKYLEWSEENHSDDWHDINKYTIEPLAK